jgi:hypothetical protein
MYRGAETDEKEGRKGGISGHRMTPDLARRRSVLTAALGFALLGTRGKPAPPEVQTVRRWLDNWRGVGDVVTGMNRQGYMLHLSNVDASTWRATFGREPMLSSEGFGAAATSWGAVQVAAWEALRAANPRGCLAKRRGLGGYWISRDTGCMAHRCLRAALPVGPGNNARLEGGRAFNHRARASMLAMRR